MSRCHDCRRRPLMLLLHLHGLRMLLLDLHRLRLRRNRPYLGQPFLFPLFRSLSRRIWIEESCWYTTSSHFLTAYPGVENCAPAQFSTLDTLELPIGSNIVVRQPGIRVTVTGWKVCNDTILTRRGFYNIIKLERGL